MRRRDVASACEISPELARRAPSVASRLSGGKKEITRPPSAHRSMRRGTVSSGWRFQCGRDATREGGGDRGAASDGFPLLFLDGLASLGRRPMPILIRERSQL